MTPHRITGLEWVKLPHRNRLTRTEYRTAMCKSNKTSRPWIWSYLSRTTSRYINKFLCCEFWTARPSFIKSRSTKKGATIRPSLISQSLLVPCHQKAVLNLLALTIEQTLFLTNKKLPITFTCLYFNFLHLCFVGRANEVGIASRFGIRVRIPVRVTSSATDQTGPASMQPPVHWVPGPYPGIKAARKWRWPPTPI
jgi:hypothetical protein